MRLEWLATEHYRLHRVEEWPESPRREATLAAIQSTLKTLSQNLPPNLAMPTCEICDTRKRPTRVLLFPDRFQIDSDRSNVAA
jgi:hypothetical protein